MGQLLLVTTLSGCYYYYMYSLLNMYTRFVVCSTAVRFVVVVCFVFLVVVVFKVTTKIFRMVVRRAFLYRR